MDFEICVAPNGRREVNVVFELERIVTARFDFVARLTHRPQRGTGSGKTKREQLKAHHRDQLPQQLQSTGEHDE